MSVTSKYIIGIPSGEENIFGQVSTPQGSILASIYPWYTNTVTIIIVDTGIGDPIHLMLMPLVKARIYLLWVNAGQTGFLSFG